MGRKFQYPVEDFNRGRPQSNQLTYVPQYLVPKRPCTIGFIDIQGSAPHKSGAKKGTSKPDSPDDDAIAQQWIADVDEYDIALDELASATRDKDYVEELTAIEHWFQPLSDAERAASIYAFAQNMTQRQIRFLLTVLQQMAKSHSIPPYCISPDKGMSTSHHNSPTSH